MRRAEMIMAVCLGLFSLYLMYLSQLAPLQIGWVPKKGPGSGAFPFWMSLGLLLCSVAIFIRGWFGMTPHSRSTEPFMDGYTVKVVSIALGSIFALLMVTEYLGAYVAIFLFLIFHVGFVGKHSFKTTALLSTLLPIGIFLLFEGGMKILLPKGITEPLFFPLYRIFVY